MSFEAKEKSVDKLLNDAIYCIPRNQRRYVWNTQNWTDIYDDVELVVDGISQSHFIGSIVLKDEGKDEGLQKYTIIDGQQRILTLTIFLASIMFMLKKRGMLDDFNGTLKYLIAKDIKAKDREIVYPEYHLSLPKIVNKLKDCSQKDLSSYSITAFANLCTVSQAKDKSIINAFKFFAGKLQNLDDEKLLATRDALIGIGYVNIISSTDEDSYTIFEILNARGLDLENHELLKNYIMRYLQPKERRDDAKRIWEEIENNLGSSIDDFLRHYALHKYNYNNDKKQSISVYKSLQNATRGRNVDKLLDDIKLKSDYYTAFINQTNCLPKEKEVFMFFKTKRVVVFRPLLLSLRHLLSLEIISENRYLKILNFIYNFYICYKIIGQENSNMLSDTVYKYAYVLETNFSDDNLEEFLKNMRSKLPTLEAFTNSFKNIGYSHCWPIYSDSKCKDRCQLVLNLIEKYISNRDVNLEVTIEHILPDSNGIENAQIGNLFLLEENLNSRCKNKSLEDKYNIYNESALMCPKGFVQRYKGKTFNPVSRTEFLSKLIYNNILGIPAEQK